MPRQILDIIPRKPLNYVRLADAVIRLEVEADRKGLPQSSLALGKRREGTADLAESAYRLALPRLVALIDRSEEIDPGFADKAGALLAELHQGQHENPRDAVDEAHGCEYGAFDFRIAYVHEPTSQWQC